MADGDYTWKCPKCGCVQQMDDYAAGYYNRRHALSPEATIGLTVTCCSCRHAAPLDLVAGGGKLSLAGILGVVVAFGALFAWIGAAVWVLFF